MCKKIKIPLESSASPFYIKHYKDGSFYKDYDRQFIVTSMVNFMRDPTGDLPWDEDPIGTDVVHIKDMDVSKLFFFFVLNFNFLKVYNMFIYCVVIHGLYNPMLTKLN